MIVRYPAPQRAGELMEMLTDPAIRAVVPPWGGETAIDLLPLLDFAAIRAAEPTWMVGYSDMSTIITDPLACRSSPAGDAVGWGVGGWAGKIQRRMWTYPAVHANCQRRTGPPDLHR